MEKVKVIDEHPNKIHDGMELFLVTGKQLTNAGAFLKGETFLTGFQENNNVRGMFSEDFEPVQIIAFDNGKYIFTMFNVTTISREGISELIKKGEYILDNNKCMSQSEREEFGELYPIYKFTL